MVIGDQAVDAGGPLSPYEEESWDEVAIGQTWFKVRILFLWRYEKVCCERAGGVERD